MSGRPRIVPRPPPPGVPVVTRGSAPRVEAVRVADGGRRAASAGAVLRTVLEHGPIARSTIARITGLSPASVTGHCAQLAEHGLLRELPDPIRSNGAGRPHVPVDIELEHHIAAAVHVAVPRTTVALLDLRGRVLARCDRPHARADPERIARTAARAIEDLAAAHGSAARVLGVGVATGGWVDPESGTVMHHPRLGWSHVPFRDVLAGHTGLPVRLDGHARSLLHGELLFGQARHAASVLHLFVGNVVDAAFATRGEAHYGSRAQAGAVAHLPVAGAHEPCACGRTGCLEAAVSELTLARSAHRQGLIDEASFPLLLTAALAGSAPAVRLLVERSRLIGRAVASLMDVFSPEATVVTDAALARLPQALEALRSSAQEHMRTHCEIDRMLLPTGFDGSVLETAGGAVLLDALYRDPFTLTGSPH